MDKRSFGTLKNFDENRIYAFFAYLSILCVIPLVQKKDVEFVQGHARQGLALFLCEFCAFLVTIILPFLLGPFLIFFGLIAFWGMFMAINGKKVALPLIYPLSQRILL